jgi:hypothetical protein
MAMKNWTQYISTSQQVKIDANTQPQPVESYTMTLSPQAFKALRDHMNGFDLTRNIILQEIRDGMNGMQV